MYKIRFEIYWLINRGIGPIISGSVDASRPFY